MEIEPARAQREVQLFLILALSVLTYGNHVGRSL